MRLWADVISGQEAVREKVCLVWERCLPVHEGDEERLSPRR